MGVPQEAIIFLKNSLGLKVAVEGGTYYGESSLKLAEHFSTVFTVEASEVIFHKAPTKVMQETRIKRYLGDTREILKKLIRENDNIFFWLDSHWSGGETHGEGDECPVLEEIKIILNSNIKNFAILIDDARYFLTPPPEPHNKDNWPSIKEICDVVTGELNVYVFEDVVYIIPNKTETNKLFRQKSKIFKKPKTNVLNKLNFLQG